MKFLEIFILVFIFFPAQIVFSQAKDEEIFTIVEKMPVHEDCENLSTREEKNQCTQEAIFKFVTDKTVYPDSAKAKGIEGIVYASFIINSYGDVTDVSILKGITNGEALEREAIRVIESLPQFTPGTQRGEAVNIRYTIPIRFNLDQSKAKRKRNRQ